MTLHHIDCRSVLDAPGNQQSPRESAGGKRGEACSCWGFAGNSPGQVVGGEAADCTLEFHREDREGLRLVALAKSL